MIQGVFIKDIVSYSDTRGFFREILRCSNDKIFKKPQISHSFVKKNIIKGFHGHLDQYQWNYLITGEIVVYLLDNRSSSPTFGEDMIFKISENQKSQAYLFPPGVLHSYKCIKKDLHILYITSDNYDSTKEIKITMTDIQINKFNNIK
jgi:dTDP-4-dehydrorhamnose 3,5-epimerase